MCCSLYGLKSEANIACNLANGSHAIILAESSTVVHRITHVCDTDSLMYEIQTAELSLYESFEFEKMRAIVNLFLL